MTDKVKSFTYTKKNGDISDRLVWVIKEPSDKMLAFDLTEFDEVEQDHIIKCLEELHEVWEEGIRDLGLHHQYRYFLKEGIDEN